MLGLGIPLTIDEMELHLLGKSVSSGTQIYKDIWTTQSAFFLWVEAFLNILPGHIRIWSFVFSIVLALILWASSAGIFSSREVFTQKNQLFGFTLVLVLMSLPTFAVASPSSLGTLFLSLFYVVTLRKQNIEGQRLFLGGILVGLAILSDFTAWPLAIYSVIVVLLVEQMNPDFVVNITFGLIASILFFLFYIWYIDGLYAFTLCISFFTHSSPFLDGFVWISSASLVWPLILIGLWSMAFISLNRSFATFQSQFIRKMFFFFIGGVAFLLLKGLKNHQDIQYLALPVAFLVAQYLIQIRKKWLAESIGFFMILIMTFNAFFSKSLPWIKFFPLEDIRQVSEPKLPVEGVPILVLGEQKQYYYQNQLATKFYNWKMTKAFLDDFDTYERVFTLRKEIDKYNPRFIIDQEGYMPVIVQRIPKYKLSYQLISESPNIYEYHPK